MAWNYRVMVRNYPNTKERYFAIYEVYYTDKGKIEYWTMNDMAPQGDTPEELKKDLKHMLKACSEEVLDYDRLTKQFARNNSKKKARKSK